MINGHGSLVDGMCRPIGDGPGAGPAGVPLSQSVLPETPASSSTK